MPNHPTIACAARGDTYMHAVLLAGAHMLESTQLVPRVLQGGSAFIIVAAGNDVHT